MEAKQKKCQNGTSKRNIKIITYSILFLLLAGMVIFACSIPIKNDKIAANVQKTLEDTPLPEYTKICDGVCRAGKLNGNGNGMQYFGAILIKSDLSIEEIENHYAKYRKNEWEYIVELQTGLEIEPVEHGYMEFSYLKGKKEADMKGYYIVYTWGSGKNKSIFSDFDLRGH